MWRYEAEAGEALGGGIASVGLTLTGHRLHSLGTHCENLSFRGPVAIARDLRLGSPVFVEKIEQMHQVNDKSDGTNITTKKNTCVVAGAQLTHNILGLATHLLLCNRLFPYLFLLAWMKHNFVRHGSSHSRITFRPIVWDGVREDVARTIESRCGYRTWCRLKRCEVMN